VTLNIHIDRLVLEGFDYSPGDVVRFESALSAELTRRFSLNGIPEELRSGGSVDALRPTNVSLPPQPTPAQSGRAIALAIHGGIGK